MGRSDSCDILSDQFSFIDIHSIVLDKTASTSFSNIVIYDNIRLGVYILTTVTPVLINCGPVSNPLNAATASAIPK